MSKTSRILVEITLNSQASCRSLRLDEPMRSSRFQEYFQTTKPHWSHPRDREAVQEIFSTWLETPSKPGKLFHLELSQACLSSDNEKSSAESWTPMNIGEKRPVLDSGGTVLLEKVCTQRGQSPREQIFLLRWQSCPQAVWRWPVAERTAPCARSAASGGGRHRDITIDHAVNVANVDGRPHQPFRMTTNLLQC